MIKVNTKLQNNYTIAEQIFDEIAVWQKTKEPKISLQSLIGKIEKVLDVIEEKGRQKNILLNRIDCYPKG